MELKIVESENEMAHLANAWVESQALAGVTNFFLPAGSTPKALYALWRRKNFSYLNSLIFTQIDEVATGAQAGVFENFLRTELPNRAGQMLWVKDSPAPAEAAILGFGTNGHIAFHEPAVPAEFAFGLVKLSRETVKKLGLEARAEGRTFGLGSFVKCRSLLLLVSGPNKNQAFAAFMRDEVTIPAAVLKTHENLTVIVDRSTVIL